MGEGKEKMRAGRMGWGCDQRERASHTQDKGASGDQEGLRQSCLEDLAGIACVGQLLGW